MFSAATGADITKPSGPDPGDIDRIRERWSYSYYVLSQAAWGRWPWQLPVLGSWLSPPGPISGGWNSVPELVEFLRFFK